MTVAHTCTHTILNSGKWPASNTAAVPPGKVPPPLPLPPATKAGPDTSEKEKFSYNCH